MLDYRGTKCREITQAVVHKMMNHCKYPTAMQIEVVSAKIVDTLGKSARDVIGVGHVSQLHICMDIACMKLFSISIIINNPRTLMIRHDSILLVILDESNFTSFEECQTTTQH